MLRTNLILCIAIYGSTVFSVVTTAQTWAEQWPTFRGSDRAAVSTESNLLDSWGDSGPKLLWTAKGAGLGYASPVVAGGRVYTLGDGPSTAQDQAEYLTCYDLNTGKQLWMAKTGPAWQGHPSNPSWNGARCTPTVDGDRIYVINPDGTLYCVSSSGQPVWQKSLVSDFGGSKHDGWGYSESPLVDGPLLIVTPGGEKATVVALDKITGEARWTCSRPGDVGAGHSSVVISHVGNRKIYVQNTAGGPMGIDAATGRLLWDYDISAPTAFIPTPIIKNDLVFTVAGYGTGGALLKQIPSKEGVAIEEIYGLNKELDNKHGGVILVGDHLYAGRGDSNQVYCADLQTGEIRWRERGSGKGSIAIIAGDGKLFVRFKDGTMALALATPEGYQEVSSFTTPGSGDAEMPSWAHPIISDGKLLLRENDSILCYDIKQ